MATRKTTKVETPKLVLDYGCPEKNPPSDKQLYYDRYAFAHRVPIDKGAPTRIQLFKSISDKLTPNYFEWHSWTERIIDTCCNYKWVGLAGCAGSAKTFNVMGFACTWWLAYPEISSVILCSTTAKSLKKRGWAEVQRYHTTMANGERFGNFVDSKMMWQCKKGDDRHAIVGIAVEDGSTTKVADNIKGVHTRRQLVIIDEATAVSGAIYDACTNLYSYPEEFMMIIIGNPRSRLDQMGRFCEPLHGWDSVNIDTEEWETKPQIDGQTGLVIRFDSEKSPNILEGRIVSRHLPTKEKVEARRNKVGSADDPGYWSNDRGFWPPDTLSKTVLSNSALIKHKASDKFLFTGRDFTILAALDPAFGGGDRAILRFAKMGEIVGGRLGIQLYPGIPLSVVARADYPVTYQLSDQLRAACRRVVLDGAYYECLPENVAIDDSGNSGLCDVVQREWSPKILRIEFGGCATNAAINYEDKRLAIDVYDDKAAEMWFRVRDAVYHEQLKGIDPDTAQEFCQRLFLDGAKIQLQPKTRDSKSGMKSYKSMFGKSPDLADTAAMILEVAMRRGFKLSAVGLTVEVGAEFEKDVEAVQAVHAEANYQEEEPPEEYTEEQAYSEML